MSFPKYILTNKQIKGIANIVLHEQGTVAGWYAEASQIANRTDIKGDSYATGKRAVDTVTSGWYAHGESRYLAGTKNETVIWIVENVFCKGLRTLPRYIDEHDCTSDIASAKNGDKSVRNAKSKWIRHQTKIRNRMGANYTFYDFPGGYNTGVDPFGYTQAASKTKETYGDFCIPVEKANLLSKATDVSLTLKLDSLPDRGYFKVGDGVNTNKSLAGQIMNVQIFLGLKGFYNGAVDGMYGAKTKAAVKAYQKKNGLDANGCFGKKCYEKAKGFRL